MARLGRIVKCTRCLKEQSIDNVRYSDDGKSIICTDCYAKLHPERLKTPAKSFTTPKTQSTVSTEEPLIQYRCIDCNYRFKSKKKNMLKCHYCGHDNLTVEGQNDQNELH